MYELLFEWFLGNVIDEVVVDFDEVGLYLYLMV